MNARDEIAVALRLLYGSALSGHNDRPDEWLRDADALMPLVDRLRAEAAAEALEAEADEMDREMAERGFRLDRIALPGDRLRKLAAALRNEADQ